jgi:hypothetical protein
MKTSHVAACGVLLAIVAAGTATTGEGEPYMTLDWEQLEIPAVRVVSTDGIQYDAIVGNTWSFMMGMSGDCLADRHVTLARAHAPETSYPHTEVDISDLLPPGQVLTPRLVYVPDTIAPVAWPSAWRKKAIDACNAHLQQKMASGSSRGAVLSFDWNLGAKYIDAPEADLYCSVPGGGTHEDTGSWGMEKGAVAYANVTCGRHLRGDIVQNPPPPPPGDITYGVHVVESHLGIVPVATATECGITLNGMVRTDFANTWVAFQYRNNMGGLTPSRLVKTDATKVAHFHDFIAFNPVSSGGFVATPQGAPAPGSFLAPSPDAQFVGTYQMDGSDPSFDSNIAGFAFDCPPGSVTVLQSPGGSRP